MGSKNTEYVNAQAEKIKLYIDELAKKIANNTIGTQAFSLFKNIALHSGISVLIYKENNNRNLLCAVGIREEEVSSGTLYSETIKLPGWAIPDNSVEQTISLSKTGSITIKLSSIIGNGGYCKLTILGQGALAGVNIINNVY